MLMKKSDMLKCLIDYYTGGNKAKFASMIGVKAQNVSAWMARDTFDAELLFSKCEGVSAEWLLSHGNGEMLTKNKKDGTIIADGELKAICKQIVDNYKQRESIINNLESMIK